MIEITGDKRYKLKKLRTVDRGMEMDIDIAFKHNMSHVQQFIDDVKLYNAYEALQMAEYGPPHAQEYLTNEAIKTWI